METAQNIISKIKTIIDQYPGTVPFAFLFGSFADDRQTPLSDIDLAIYFQNAAEDKKMQIEQRIALLFDEPVNILRLEDDDISPAVRLDAVAGLPIISPDIDLLNGYTLSIIHRAHEYRNTMERLKKVA